MASLWLISTKGWKANVSGLEALTATLDNKKKPDDREGIIRLYCAPIQGRVDQGANHNVVFLGGETTTFLMSKWVNLLHCTILIFEE
jgi:hypothetical protein